MKTIQTLLPTAIIVASLSPSMGAQLRANWRVQYDTSRTCQSGAVVATLQPPSSSQGRATRPTSVAFRVAKGQGTAPYYAKTARFQPNGQAKVSLPVREAFAPSSKGKASSPSCTLQVGTKIQKVACPILPKCPTRSPTSSPTHMDTLAPTESPTHIDTLAPTESPTHMDTLAPTESPTHMDTLAPTESPTHMDTLAPTESPTHMDTLAPTESPTSAPTEDLESLAYDVNMESGPVLDTPSCFDAYLTVTVLHQSGQPVQGAEVDLLVVGNEAYNVGAATDAAGKATMLITLDPADETNSDQLWTSLVVENPKYPSGDQQYVPVLNFGC